MSEKFAELYERYAPQLASYFRKERFDGDTPSDLMHEVFLRYLRNRHEHAGSEIRSEQAYLFRIAQHLVLEIHRSPKQSPRDAESFDEATHGQIAPEDDGRKADLERAIAQLSRRNQAIVRLRMADVTFAEIARRLNIPVGTAQSRYKTARGQLRRILAGNQGRETTR